MVYSADARSPDQQTLDRDHPNLGLFRAEEQCLLISLVSFNHILFDVVLTTN